MRTVSELRIFSYLPNPRIWKATIAARLYGVEIEVRGAAPKELEGWLWDFDARPLSPDEQHTAENVRMGTTGFKGTRLHKTDAFLEAHPFGTVPAAFSADGRTGIFESNSILRAVARLGERRCPLYGRDPYEASRIDSFLDASLVFARDAQLYLLALMGGTVSAEMHGRARDAFATYMTGIDRALRPSREFLVGESMTIADICFVAEIALFFNEKARAGELAKAALSPIVDAAAADGAFPGAMAHFARLRKHDAFAPDVEPYLRKIEARA